MMRSLDLLQSLGAWSIEGVWMPLVAWTVLAGLVWCGVRLWRSSPPLVSYAVLTSLLLALPLGVLLSLITDVSLIAVWTPSPSSVTLPALPPSLAPPVAIAETTAPGFSWTLLHTLGALVLGAGLMTGVAFFRLSLHSYRLAHLRRHLPTTPVVAANAFRILNEQIDMLGLRVRVRLVVTAHDVVPMTFGWRRPVIVIPASLLDDGEALRLTLLHELVHIRRADYLLQWIGNVVGALFAIHPVVWLLRREIADYRELACDAAVLAQPHISSKRYATLLYRFALIRSDQPQLALSMAASHRELKTRITAMTLHKTIVHRYSPRLVALTLAGLLMGLTTLVVACTDFVGPDPEAETVAAKLDNEQVYVVVEEMPVLIGGLEAIQQELQYPQIAKMAGIEGRVFVQFIVDAQGKVVNPEVVRGLGAGCDEEAIRALQAATFKPGRQAGKEVPVKMTIPVAFRLDDEAASAQRSLTQAEQMIVEKRRIEASRQRQALAEDAGRPLSKEEEQALTDVLKEVEKMRAQGNLVGHTEELTEDQIKTLKATMQALEARLQNAPPPPIPSASETPQNQGSASVYRLPPPPPSSTADVSTHQIRVTSDGDVLTEGVDFTVNQAANTVSITNPAYLGANRAISISH